MRSVIDQIRWVQNPLQGLEQTVARGQQTQLQRERFEEQKRQIALSEQQQQEAQDINKRMTDKHRRMRTMKLMDKGLGIIGKTYKQDPSGIAAQELMGYFQSEFEQNPDLYDPELTERFHGVQMVPGDWAPPEGEQQTEKVLSPNQIPSLRRQMAIGMEGMGMAVTPQEEQERAKRQVNIEKVQVDIQQRKLTLSADELDLLGKQQEVEADIIGNMLGKVYEIEGMKAGGKKLTGEAGKKLVLSLFGELNKLQEANILSTEEVKQRRAEIMQSLGSPAGVVNLKNRLVRRQQEVSTVNAYTEEQLRGAAIAAEELGQPGILTDTAQWLMLLASDRSEFIKRGNEKQRELAQQQSAFRTRERRAGRSQVNVSTGTSELGAAQTGREQERLVDARQVMRFIGDIKALGDPAQFLGYMRRAEFWMKDKQRKAKDVPLLGDILGNLSTAERMQYEKASEFRSIVKKYKSLEYKKLIGSAQTATEVKNLADSIISVDMSDTVFRRNLELLERETKRIAQAAEDALAHGYKLNTKEFRGYTTAKLEPETILRKVKEGKMSKREGLRRVRTIRRRYGHLVGDQ